MKNWLEDREKWLRQFNKREYAAAFQAYREDCRSSVESLDQAFRESGTEEGLKAAAEELIQQVERQCKETPGSYKRARRECAYGIVCYLIPALRSLALPCCPVLEQQILKAWSHTYPDSPIRGGSFEQIQAGFPQRSLLSRLFRRREGGKG